MGDKTGAFEWFKRSSRYQKTGVVTGLAVILYTVFGFLAAPLILKAVLEKKSPSS